jgi:hypothetical protein
MTIAGTAEPIDTIVIGEWEYDIAAATTIKQGERLIMTPTGLKPVDGVPANGIFCGFPRKAYANPGAAGAVRAVVKFNRTYACTRLPISAVAPATKANLFQMVYLNAASEICTTNSTTPAGKLIAIGGDGRALVAMD